MKFSVHNQWQNRRGFSLLEILIVLSILALLGAAGSGFYRSVGKSVELSSVGQEISADLRHMQSKAMVGEQGRKWGVRFVNSTSGYYQLFSTPTTYADGGTEVIATTTLSKSISFSDPATDTSKEIVFSRISGTTTPTTVVLVSENASQTVTVTSLGTIY